MVETTHARIHEDDMGRIEAMFGDESTAEKIGKLVQFYQLMNLEHDPELKEQSGPTGSYVHCRDCGRSENTLDKLESRPCEDGISVKE